MSGVSHNIDRYGVVFDDEGLVADAGLLVAGTLIGWGWKIWWMGRCAWGAGWVERTRVVRF